MQKKVKTVELTFYSITTPETEGIKYVLFKVTDAHGVVTYDWGMSEWVGKQWGFPEIPEGYSCSVAWWSEPLHPSVLLKEKSKIISLN